MKKLTILFIGLMGLNFSVSGQRIVTGKVVDIETKKPIKDAEVIVDGTNTMTKTNELGLFELTIDTTNALTIKNAEYETGNLKVPLELSSFQVGLTRLKSASIQSDSGRRYTVVEKSAEFPGGLVGLYKYISRNLKYPKEAWRNGISGKVLVEFIVDRTGSIPFDSIKIKQGLCPSCDEEAIRLIRESPKWDPGMQNGKPVNSRFVMPIIFK